MKKLHASLNWLAESLMGWRFPVFIIGFLTFFELLLIALLIYPSSETGIGMFARDFKTWCFNYDPATGQISYFFTFVMLTQPLVLLFAVIGIWRHAMLDGWRTRKPAMARVLFTAFLTTCTLGAALTFWGADEPSYTDYPFPAERLRTSMEPPNFSLLNQDGDTVSLQDLHGKVVVLTGVYATCNGACPVIMIQLKRVVDKLDPELLDDLVVVAITLDPENDHERELTDMAYRHSVSAPLYNFVHGDPDTINPLLDKLSFSRARNAARPEDIDHSNMYVLLDRQSKIAFRLSLGDRTEPWLATALNVLLQEDDQKIARLGD